MLELLPPSFIDSIITCTHNCNDFLKLSVRGGYFSDAVAKSIIKRIKLYAGK